jgi:peptide/nickel transport system permease protein
MRGNSPWYNFLGFVRRYARNKAAVFGFFILLIMAGAAVSVSMFVPYDACLKISAQNRLQDPSAIHWFGTDNSGRDIFTRVLYGARFSLSIGLGATLVSLVLSSLIAAACCMYGGKVDMIVMRVLDAIACIPFILLALTIIAALGSGIFNLILAMTLATIPMYTRMVRSVLISIVNQDYIQAAALCGTGGAGTIFRHVLPNAVGPLLVLATASVAAMMLAAAGLSFVGMGLNPPTPEWGVMLSDAARQIRNSIWMLVFPGLALSLTALSINLVGDGLQAAIDPRNYA